MENDNSQKQATESAVTDSEVIISEEQNGSDHVDEQHISKGSSNNDKDEPETNTAKSGGESSTKEPTETDAVNKESEAKTAAASGGESSTAKQPAEESADKQPEKVLKGQVSKDGGTIGDYDEYKHESPTEIRKHQLEDLHPDPNNPHAVAYLLHTLHGHGGNGHVFKKVQPESYLWLSIFTVIFFSRIFGLIALYKSIKVRLLFAEGNIDESEKASNDAKKWNLVGMIFCVCWVLLIVVLFKTSGLFDMKE